MLNLETLDSLPAGEIFQTGTFVDNYEEGDGNIALCFPVSNKIVRWVAVKGDFEKHSDWCIYCENPHEYAFRSIHDIKRRGDKIYGAKNIKKLVQCTDEAFDRYRR